MIKTSQSTKALVDRFAPGQPNKQGLGMGHVFDELNRLYGDGFIKY